MNNNILIGLVVVVLIIVGVYSQKGNKDAKDEMMKVDVATGISDQENQIDDVMMKSEGSVITSDTSSGAMVKAGTYESYAPEKLIKADDGKVVLFFKANWCPTCRTLDSDITANLTEIPTNLTILNVDYDNSSELKKKYGVTYQHTFVQVDKDGNQIAKWSGSPTLSAMVKEIK